jgi:hypothetical protein
MNKRLQFESYSYLESLFWGFCELLPAPLRMLIFGLVFRKFGRGCIVDYGTYFRYPRKILICDQTAINRGCWLYASHTCGSSKQLHNPGRTSVA